MPASVVEAPVRAQGADLRVPDLAADIVAEDQGAVRVLDRELIVALAQIVARADKPL